MKMEGWGGKLIRKFKKLKDLIGKMLERLDNLDSRIMKLNNLSLLTL